MLHNEYQTSKEVTKRENTVLRHEQAQEIEACKKKPRISHLQYGNVIVYHTESFSQNTSFDTFWILSFNSCGPNGIVKDTTKRHLHKKFST